MHACMHVCMYVCMHASMYVCVCVCVCMWCVYRHPSGQMLCSSFHAQLPRISQNQSLMGTRVQLFVNNIPTGKT